MGLPFSVEKTKEHGYMPSGICWIFCLLPAALHMLCTRNNFRIDVCSRVSQRTEEQAARQVLVVLRCQGSWDPASVFGEVFSCLHSAGVVCRVPQGFHTCSPRFPEVSRLSNVPEAGGRNVGPRSEKMMGPRCVRSWVMPTDTSSFIPGRRS